MWRVDIGRIPLYRLDSERPENDRLAHWITSRFYVGITRKTTLNIAGRLAFRGRSFSLPDVSHAPVR